MLLEDFIIHIYLIVEDFLQGCGQIRRGGRAPKLSDSEVITMEIVGEYLGLGYEKRIYDYFKTHWLTWFPALMP